MSFFHQTRRCCLVLSVVWTELATSQDCFSSRQYGDSVHAEFRDSLDLSPICSHLYDETVRASVNTARLSIGERTWVINMFGTSLSNEMQPLRAQLCM